ncbi:TAXI family TRAP transporter solute-binding subunit [Mariluticola halotolerans]|uniref:TAXI family TRAP transporter solute-binding subunit n=1 Tax=Mariluticola halotolerans TaxID=2909283 RepID=UPI0026E23A6D|nr:TAXI family TRAP transporter solute-binding subunit [Mariluticola halotolerans]UJQ95936.1 TAXI family TRAP transporter solute-binding subunit [Mariluticola halotolerans]
MNKTLAHLLVSLGLICVSTSIAQSRGLEVNIMTGSSTGTYIQIGKDIGGLAEHIGRNVTAVESAGSLENIEAVRKRPLTQFGIVQSDVLDFIRTFRQDDVEMSRMARNTRIVFPLYNEEVHIVVRRSSGLNVLADLSGRTVAIGEPNSGTNLTSTFLFEVANVRPQNMLTISSSDGMAQLRTGAIDAFVYVAGAPTKLLADAAASDDLKLLSVSSESVGGYYGTSTIPAGTYPWQKEDVTTAAVRAVLMTFEYDPRRNDYFKQSCQAVTEISYLIKEHLDVLQATGHPKWKQVDLSAIPPGWEVAQCVQTALQEGYRLPVDDSSIVPAAISTPSTGCECSNLLNPVAHRLCLMRICNAE